MNDPLLLLVVTAGGLGVAKLWLDDRRQARAGTPNPRALPGATEAPRSAVIVAVAGALGLVALETAGEAALGLTNQQSRMTWLFAFYSVLGAPVIEELVFRGWLVVDGRGRSVQWAAAAGASLVFALGHPFLWTWDAAGWTWTLGLKGGFSTAIAALTSLWLYAARLGPWNPQRSLLPCFAAHAAKNAAVVAVKAATGFMGALW